MFPTLKVHGSRNAKNRFYWHFHLMFWLPLRNHVVSAGRSSPSTNEVPLRCTCLGGERPLEPAAQLLELEGWPKSLEETEIQNIQTYLQLWPMQHGCWFPKKQILISHVFTWDCAWNCCGKRMMKRRVCFSSKTFSTYISNITMAFFLWGVIALSQIVRSTSVTSSQGTEVVFFLTSPEGIQALIAASGDAELLVRLGMCNRRSHWLTNLDCWCENMSCCVEAVNWWNLMNLHSFLLCSVLYRHISSWRRRCML